MSVGSLGFPNLPTCKGAYKKRLEPKRVHYLPLISVPYISVIIFGGINFGEISTIHRISIEIRSLKIFTEIISHRNLS